MLVVEPQHVDQLMLDYSVLHAGPAVQGHRLAPPPAADVGVAAAEMVDSRFVLLIQAALRC